jgi:hypothetical protein
MLPQGDEQHSAGDKENEQETDLAGERQMAPCAAGRGSLPPSEARRVRKDRLTRFCRGFRFGRPQQRRHQRNYSSSMRGERRCVKPRLTVAAMKARACSSSELWINEDKLGADRLH